MKLKKAFDWNSPFVFQICVHGLVLDMADTCACSNPRCHRQLIMLYDVFLFFFYWIALQWGSDVIYQFVFWEHLPIV